ELLRDPALLARVKADAAARIARIPPRAEGVSAAPKPHPGPAGMRTA
ncbi:MAG: hypothetical protein K0R70_669, partial [Steroidobacteraceae bacterium]|nr:hypothetical protein [Steroidobacteraceae bacterium]